VEVRPGRPSTTRGQGASRCDPFKVREGALVLSSSRLVHWCCFLRVVLDSTHSAQPASDLAVGSGRFGVVVQYRTTLDASIFSFVQTPHPSWPSIMVGDGSYLPVTSVGFAPGPFRLSNVLIAPQMVHNLLTIRQFTTNKSCSVEFDTSGLTVKDLTSRRQLHRCDSLGPFTLRLPLLHLHLRLLCQLHLL
jgi:hypothetical protein